jgi:hypothetical protein
MAMKTEIMFLYAAITPLMVSSAAAQVPPWLTSSTSPQVPKHLTCKLYNGPLASPLGYSYICKTSNIGCKSSVPHGNACDNKFWQLPSWIIPPKITPTLYLQPNKCYAHVSGGTEKHGIDCYSWGSKYFDCNYYAKGDLWPWSKDASVEGYCFAFATTTSTMHKHRAER